MLREVTLRSTASRAFWLTVALAAAGVLALVASSIDLSAETVVLNWAFDRVLEFVRWVAEYLVGRGLELTEELLAWLRLQWERFAGNPGGSS